MGLILASTLCLCSIRYVLAVLAHIAHSRGCLQSPSCGGAAICYQKHAHWLNSNCRGRYYSIQHYYYGTYSNQLERRPMKQPPMKCCQSSRVGCSPSINSSLFSTAPGPHHNWFHLLRGKVHGMLQSADCECGTWIPDRMHGFDHTNKAAALETRWSWLQGLTNPSRSPLFDASSLLAARSIYQGPQKSRLTSGFPPSCWASAVLRPPRHGSSSPVASLPLPLSGVARWYGMNMRHSLAG